MAEVHVLPTGGLRVWRELEPTFRQILQEKGADAVLQQRVLNAFARRAEPLLQPVQVNLPPVDVASQAAVDLAVARVAAVFQQSVNRWMLEALDLELCWQRSLQNQP
jgi:hypothetical protein